MEFGLHIFEPISNIPKQLLKSVKLDLQFYAVCVMTSSFWYLFIIPFFLASLLISLRKIFTNDDETEWDEKKTGFLFINLNFKVIFVLCSFIKTMNNERIRQRMKVFWLIINFHLIAQVKRRKYEIKEKFPVFKLASVSVQFR